MEQDEQYIIRLRDCFTAGYTLPQFCIDNGIKKPLFVSEEKFLQFAWEIYVQFKFDKRMMAQFSFLDLPSDKVKFSTYNILASLKYKNFSETNLDDFDKIILLTTKDVEVAADKKISLNALTTHLIQMTFAEIPVLKFLQRYPQVNYSIQIFRVTSTAMKAAKNLRKLLSGIKILQKKSNGTKAKSFRRRSTN